MLTAIGHAPAQSLRANRAAGAKSAFRLTSRVRIPSRANPLAAVAGGPTCVRFIVSRRGFASTRLVRAPSSSLSSAAAKAKGTTPRKRTAAAGTKTKTAAAGAKKKKKKKAVKKAAPKKKRVVRKVLTKEEKRKLEIKELKKIALQDGPAKRLPDRSWVVFVTQKINGSHMNSSNMADTMKDISREFKRLTESELERLKATAKQNYLTNQAAYKSWVEGHSPAVIANANRARARLTRIGKEVPLIKDERQPKRPLTPFSLFIKSRYQSGGLEGRGTAAQVVGSLAAEWKGLSEEERKPYHDSWKADKDRYVADSKSILGKDVKFNAKRTTATA